MSNRSTTPISNKINSSIKELELIKEYELRVQIRPVEFFVFAFSL